MSKKKFLRDDLEIASYEEMDQVAYGDDGRKRKDSGDNSRSIPRK
jgi:hypothetical protein